MLNNELVASKTAAYKKDSRKEFDKAVAALIALAYRYRRFGAEFLWDKDPELEMEANRICRELSDALAQRAKLTAAAIMEDSLAEYDFDEAWDAETGDDFVPVITRFDQQGSFLKELLEVWIALAFVHSLTQGELRVLISRYLANPFTSPLWKDLPKDILAWGRGYSKDIASQIAVIGQNAIIAAIRNAEWQDAMANGASYYIRRRGSYYDCPDCDELCGYPIPIEQPFVFLHSRCCCLAEYHFEPMPL